MHQAPFDERVDLHKYSFALDTWEQAAKTLELLRKHEKLDGPQAIISNSLRIAFFVLYGRPFKQKPPFRVGDSIVPDEFVDHHKTMIIVRDKIVAHYDADLTDSSGQAINKINFLVTKRGFEMGHSELRPREGTHDRYAMLVAAVRDKALFWREKIAKRWGRHLKLPVNSQWFVNVRKDCDDVLLPFSIEERVYWPQKE